MDLEEEWTNDMIWFARLSERDTSISATTCLISHMVSMSHTCFKLQPPVWKRMFDQGKLNAEQSHFWKTKPPEELYDLRQDRDEVKNLANSREHSDILKRSLMPTWPISIELSMWAFFQRVKFIFALNLNPYEMA